MGSPLNERWLRQLSCEGDLTKDGFRKCRAASQQARAFLCRRRKRPLSRWTPRRPAVVGTHLGGGWAGARYCAIYRRARAFAQDCGSSEHDSIRKRTDPQEPGDRSSRNFSRRRAGVSVQSSTFRSRSSRENKLKLKL